MITIEYPHHTAILGTSCIIIQKFNGDFINIYMFDTAKRENGQAATRFIGSIRSNETLDEFNLQMVKLIGTIQDLPEVLQPEGIDDISTRNDEVHYLHCTPSEMTRIYSGEMTALLCHNYRKFKLDSYIRFPEYDDTYPDKPFYKIHGLSPNEAHPGFVIVQFRASNLSDPLTGV